MTGKKSLPGQGAISKNPPREFTIEELAKWLAKLNPEFGISEDIQGFERLITDALDSGELIIRGNPQFQLPGRCPDCHRKWQAQLTIPLADVREWCSRNGINYGGEADQTCNEKTVRSDTREALLSVIRAMYQDINEALLPLVDKNQLPYYLQRKIKEHGRLTPSGYGEYLTNDRAACKSAKEIVPEAQKLTAQTK